MMEAGIIHGFTRRKAMNPQRSLLIALIVVAIVLPAAAFAGQKPPAPPPDLQAQVTALAAQVSLLQTTVTAQAAQITALQTTLGAIQANSVMALAPYLTVTTDARGPLALFSGVNIQLVNGEGATGSRNGLGNLIVGYDEERHASGTETCANGVFTNQEDCVARGYDWAVNHKSGSHYLVIGDTNNYSMYGGMVVSSGNTSSAPGATVSGGYGNTASGLRATVSGGGYNTARGEFSTVCGGSGNTASGIYTTVSGGLGNTASGGVGPEGGAASVSGGYGNTASGRGATVSGGWGNTASGFNATVGGGQNRSATGPYDWVAGELFQDQ
jgi:outer membrane murein-binding lipoprotein Lpp